VCRVAGRFAPQRTTAQMTTASGTTARPLRHNVSVIHVTPSCTLPSPLDAPPRYRGDELRIGRYKPLVPLISFSNANSADESLDFQIRGSRQCCLPSRDSHLARHFNRRRYRTPRSILSTAGIPSRSPSEAMTQGRAKIVLCSR